MRIKTSGIYLEKIFNALKEKIGSLAKIASIIHVHPRTLSDWKNNKTTIPIKYFEELTRLVDIRDEDITYKKLPELWHIKAAARKGGYRRMELHGELGTPEGRRIGGIHSIKTHRKMKNGFKTLKAIKTQKKSEKLAEFLGILIGDGHLSDYQVSITTNSKTDMEHALFIKKLIKQLFGISAHLTVKKNENTVTIVASSKNLVKFMNKNGMPIGNKIKNNLRMPKWINESNSYKKAFMRGLFDTDGCIYIDAHKIRGKTYTHFGWTITSYADKLLLDIIKTLNSLGFTPRNRKTQKSVFLRKQREISKYFREIGTSNAKHYKRYFGRVPKRS